MAMLMPPNARLVRRVVLPRLACLVQTVLLLAPQQLLAVVAMAMTLIRAIVDAAAVSA